MNEISKNTQLLPNRIEFTIARTFRNVKDLRQWMQHPERDRTNYGFLNVQIAYDTRKEYRAP